MPVSARYRYLYLVLILVSTLSIIQTPALISINLLCVNNSHLNVLESIQQFIICVYFHHVLKQVWTNTVIFMNPMTKAIVKNYVNQTRNFFSLDLDPDPNRKQGFRKHGFKNKSSFQRIQINSMLILTQMIKKNITQMKDFFGLDPDPNPKKQHGNKIRFQTTYILSCLIVEI